MSTTRNRRDLLSLTVDLPEQVDYATHRGEKFGATTAIYTLRAYHWREPIADVALMGDDRLSATIYADVKHGRVTWPDALPHPPAWFTAAAQAWLIEVTE